MSLLQRTLLAGLLLLVAARTGGAQVLAVPETEQEQSQWCWAAVSAACLSYYANPVAQCVIAEYTRTVATWHDFGDDDCCQVPWGACNYWNYNWGAAGSIEDILDHWSVASYGTGRALSQAEVGDMIADDRPFIIRWGWDGGGGHFLVGHGLVGADLHYMDPWYGEGLQVASYDWVVSGGNHSWTHTNVITEHHCSCHTSDACCDGCDPINEGGGCDDGDACSLSDTCQAGACSGTGAVVCQPIDQCHAAGQCDPASGECSTPELADGTACDDGDACTQTDTCQAGACSGSDAVVCQPIDQCHAAGQCDPASGECSTPELADGTGCDDGDACTQTDTCQAGACSGADPVVCQPIDQCHAAGTCDPASGQCSTPALADGTGCDDGDACTQSDSCQAGVCVGADPVVCEPLDQCHVAGSCDPQTGSCSQPAAEDGSACDDGNPCTGDDACSSGACTGQALADWTACQPDGACFDAACEYVPAGDRCDDPLLLEPELPRAVSPGEYHRWVGAAPPCTDASHDGADVFFAAAVEPQQRYALRIAADTGAELLAVLRDDCQSLEACPLQEPLVGGDTPVEVLECDFDRSQRAVFQLVLPADAALETLRVELVERDAGGCGCAGGGRPGAGCGWLLLGLLAALLLRRRFMPCPQRGAAAAAKNRAELLRISAGREDSGAW
jgi:hypothetical protein